MIKVIACAALTAATVLGGASMVAALSVPAAPPPSGPGPLSTCPYDGTKFAPYRGTSRRIFEDRLDVETYTQSRWLTTQFALSTLAVCPTNGVVLFEFDSGNGPLFSAEELERLRPYALSSEYQELRGETARYRLALLKIRAGASTDVVFRTLLEATLDTEDPAAYRRYASHLLAHIGDEIANLPDSEKRWGRQALRVELLRRMGRFEEAEASAQQALSTIETGTFFHLVVGFQRELIARRFDEIERVPPDFRDRAEPSSYRFAQIRPFDPAKTTRLRDVEARFLGSYFLWSLDGRTLASRYDGRFRVFGFDGAPSRDVELPADFGRVRLALPDGQWLFAPTDQRAVTGRLIRVDRNLAVASDQRFGNALTAQLGIATTNAGANVFLAGVRLDPANGTLAPYAFPQGDVQIVAGDRAHARLLLIVRGGPDGNRLVYWEALQGRALWSVPIPLEFFVDAFGRAEISRDGTRAYVAISCGRHDCDVMSLDMRDGASLALRQFCARPMSLSVSGRDGMVALACGQTLYLLDRDFKELERIDAERSGIGGVAFSPDGSRLAIGANRAVFVHKVGK
jgi:hypothetical protein